jgi:acylphosphatase
MEQTISITVSGKVHGVYYRHSTKEKADELSLTGTVENLKNGNVFIIATGDKEQLDKLTAWCYKGPRRAAVSKVEVKELPLQLFEAFDIKR